MKKLYLAILSMLLMSEIAIAGDYPKTSDERKAEEMGSLMGDEGIVFHPGRIRNLSTKTADAKVNQYLWQAALDTVDFTPIISSDPNTGVIATDWYSDKKDTTRSLKLKVSIIGDTISTESVKTELKQRVKKEGIWVEDNAPSNIQMEVEDKILRRARQLYIRKSNK